MQLEIGVTVPTKRCPACRTDKTLDAFGSNVNMADGKQWACKKCTNRLSKERYARQADVHCRRNRNARFKREYGITHDEFDAMLVSQGNCCSLCRAPKPGGRGRFHVDHDHVTGTVRGLLCHRCNLMLGNAQDNPIVLERAVAYLEGNK